MKRSGSDYWALHHDDFWDAEEVLRMKPAVKAAFLFLLGLQAKHGSLPVDPRTIAALAAPHFPNFLRWYWPTLEQHFPIEVRDGVDQGRRNPRQARETDSIDARRGDDAAKKRLQRAKKATCPEDVPPREERRGEERREEEGTGTKDVPPGDGLREHPKGFNLKPVGAPQGKRQGPGTVDVARMELPAVLDLPAVRSALVAYQTSRRELRRPALGAVGMSRLVAKLAGWGPARAVAALEHSVANGWQGVFEPKEGEGPGSPHAGPSAPVRPTPTAAETSEYLQRLRDQPTTAPPPNLRALYEAARKNSGGLASPPDA